VAASSAAIQRTACSRLEPHISIDGRSPEQHDGRSGRPKIEQRFAASSCTQRTPAGLPSGMPGIGLEIEGAVQHAPHADRHSMAEPNKRLTGIAA
jgi:hypothetical protein